MILKGELAPGSKLPSSRSFSSLMSISRNSVLAGIERLIDEGYLFTKQGSGTYVSTTLPDQLIHVEKSSSIQTLAETTIPVDVSTSVQRLQPIWDKSAAAIGKDQLFSIGIGCTDLFPHALWGRLLSRAWRHYPQQTSHSNDPMGFLPLRQAIAAYASATRGLHCTAEHILITHGTQQAINLTAQVLLKQGDEVWLDEPGYDGALGAFTAMGAKVRPVVSDQEGMDIAYGIQHWPNAKMIFTAPSHQFPLGGTLSLSRRLALLDWATENQAWIFEDDYNSEFRYKSRPIQALQGLDTTQRVIYAGTFSKMMFPELRLGFLVLPPTLTQAFKLAKHYADSSNAYLEQATLAMFIAEGHYARHVRRVRKACDERQQSLIAAIQHDLPKHFQLVPSDSGIHLLCYLAAPWVEKEMIEKCRQLGIGAQPLSRYCQNPFPKPGILFGFAAHTPSEIQQGIQILAQELLKTADHRSSQNTVSLSSI